MKKIVLRIIPILMILSIVAIILFYTGWFGVKSDNAVLEAGIWALAIGYLFSIITIIFVLLLERGNPSKTLIWLVLILLLPGAGVILYAYLGANFQEESSAYDPDSKVNQLVEKLHDKCIDENCDEKELTPKVLKKAWHLGIQKNINYLRNNPEAMLTVNNKIEILDDGEETFRAILKELPKAKHHIHLEYFIWMDDDLGDKFKAILIERAKAGVEVRIIFDGVGSMSLKSSYLRELKDAGIEIAAFRPMRWAIMNAKSNQRNHRKIIVIDGKIGFTGGINVDNKYLAGDPKLGHWRDTHLQVEGDAVIPLQITFLLDWHYLKEEFLNQKIYFPKSKISNDNLVHIIASGSNSEWDGIKQMYLNTLYTVQDYIWLATPYFVPNGTTLNAIKTAALCGCEVKLLIPKKADSAIVQNATMSFVEELLGCGIQIYQYEKGFLHSKIMLCDDVIGTVGSANIDTRSFDQNLEINTVFYYKEPIEQLKKTFTETLKDCSELTLEKFKERGNLVKIREGVCRLLAPLL